MEKQNPIRALEGRLVELIGYLDNFSPLQKLIGEARPYVENSGRYAQFLQTPEFFDINGKVKTQYVLRLKNLKEEANNSKINNILWKANTLHEAVSLLGISGEIKEDQKELREYLTFLKLYIDTAMSDPPVYVLSQDDLNTEITKKAVIQLIDNKRKILPLLDLSKEKLREYSEMCHFQTIKQLYKRKTLEGELRRSVERLLSFELDEDKPLVEPKTFNFDEMGLYLALRICEDYYEREILPKLKPVNV